MKRKKFLQHSLLLTGLGFLKSSRLFAAYCKTRKFFVNRVKFIWSGAITANSVRVNAKLDTATTSARLVLSTNSNLSNPVYSPYTIANASNSFVAKLSATGLSPNTIYYYAVEADGDIDTAIEAIGRFKTANIGAQSFKFSVASCYGSGNHPVLLRIKEKVPLFHITHGDFHYGDPNSATDINVHRYPFDVVLRLPNMKDFLRSVPIAYMWDDHDFCGDNSYSLSVGRTNARLVFQEYVPHFPLAAGTGNLPIYQAFTIGRLRFIMTDLRSERDGSSIMGATQKTWFKSECLTAKNADQAIVWISSVPWGGTIGDTWADFSTERTELSNYFKANNIRNLLIVCGDAHMLGIDNGNNNDFSTGANNPYKYPVLQAAAASQAGSFKGGIFSHGIFQNPNANYGQYALVDINDTGGTSVGITITGYRVTLAGIESVLLSYSFNFSMLSVLPLKIAKFSVKEIQPSKALLEWEIILASSICQEIFIERNADGFSFVQLTRIDCNTAAGNSSWYSFIDQFPLPGKNYYRIKLVEQTGSVLYSAIEAISFSKKISVVVVNNPIKDQLRLSIEAPYNTVLDYSIEDSNARLVLKNRLQVNRGTNSAVIKLGDVSAGVYFLILLTKEKPVVKKFIVE